MTAIFKREFKAFFQSVIGFIFIAANLLLIGIYFFAYNLNGCYPYFSYTISSCVYIFMVTIPILTMRILSEDRKNKTDQLILTSPVSVTKIVLGKFFAVAAVFMILIAIICFYPLIMGLYGTVPYKETYTAILGFALYGLSGISIGVFISSITESQIIAAVLSFAALFITYLMEGICSLISETGNGLTRFLSIFDISSRFYTFMEGTLELSSFVYLISVIVLMLFLTTQSIQKRRYSVSVKNLKMGAYSTGAIVLFITATVIVNLVVAKLPEKYTIFDMTSNQLYSITDDTKKLLASLDEEIDIYVYCSEENFDVTCNEILRRYAAETKKVNLQYVDPVTNPQFYKSYSSSVVQTGTIFVVCGEKSKVVLYDDLYQVEYTMDYTTYSYNSDVTGIDVEGQITSAIAFVTSEESHTIYVTEGHGEQTLETSYKDIISKANVSLAELTTIKADCVPDDCECLIINGPTADFNDHDLEIVRDYINRGGQVVITLAVSDNEAPNLYAFINELGLTVNFDIVTESDRNYYFNSPFYLLPDITYTTITSDIYSGYYIFAPYALAMTINEELDDSLSVTEFLGSSSKSYAKSLSGEITTYEKEDGDLEGPFTVGAIVKKVIDDDTTAEIIVMSTCNVLTERSSEMVSGTNVKLFSNIVSQMVHYENNVSIPAKSYDIQYLVMTTENMALWRNLTMILLPAGLTIFGLVIWLQRRKK